MRIMPDCKIIVGEFAAVERSRADIDPSKNPNNPMKLVPRPITVSKNRFQFGALHCFLYSEVARSTEDHYRKMIMSFLFSNVGNNILHYGWLADNSDVLRVDYLNMC